MNMHDYFTVNSRSGSDGRFSYEITLNPGSEVYKGHFPGNPVSPGVFNMGMIAACASDAAGRELHIRNVSRCRFLAIISPSETPSLNIEFSVSAAAGNDYAVSAKITDGERTFVDFKGEMTEFSF